MTRVLAAIAGLVVAVVACTHAEGVAGEGQAKTPPPGTPRVATQGSDAQTIAGFNQRLKQYGDIHTKLEKTLPPLPKEADPKVIDKHQRALETLLKAERKGARRGDIFGPDVERMIRRMFGQLFTGAEGAKLKSTIMDENPVGVKLAVNDRYPDQVPLSTMPPQVLALLPKLPEELEYRFIGDRLVLFDVHSHTVADYIENALP